MIAHDPNARSFSRAEFLRLMAAAGIAVAAGPDGASAAAPIRRKPIPKTGEELPMVGLGTWQTFDVGTDKAARAPLTEVLRILFDAGGKAIDSSPMYGASEQVVGDLLTESNAHAKAFLATKVWTSGKDAGVRQMENSFRRMRTERMDLMQVHNLLDWRTHLATLQRWKELGRVRYIGITHYTSSALDDLSAVIEKHPIDFVQMAYSISVRDAERRLLPLAADKGVAVLVNRPFEGGGLFRSARAKPLPPWAVDIDCPTWGQFFLKFILAHPAVTCVIPGTSKPHHMMDNVAAGLGRLPGLRDRDRMAAYVEGL